jgi:hypothetical protein
MTCNHCHPLCQCGAEEAAGRRLLEGFREVADEMCADEPQWPELEAMEAALANYGEAA